MCHFVLVLFSPFSILITSLGEKRSNLSAFRTFVRFVLVWICRFSLPLDVWEGLRFVIVALPGLFSYLFFIKSLHTQLYSLRGCIWPRLHTPLAPAKAVVYFQSNQNRLSDPKGNKNTIYTIVKLNGTVVKATYKQRRTAIEKLLPSRKHAYIILTPLNPTFI